MKQALFLAPVLLSATMFAAPDASAFTGAAPGYKADNAEQRRFCSPKTESNNVGVIQRWLDGLVAGQASTLIPELWTADSIVSVPPSLPYGGEITRDGQGAYGLAVNTTWDTSELGSPELYGRCNKVFAVTRWTATVRATGIRVDQPLIEVFELKDGKITKDTLYFFDTQELVNAIKGPTATAAGASR